MAMRQFSRVLFAPEGVVFGQVHAGCGVRAAVIGLRDLVLGKAV